MSDETEDPKVLGLRKQVEALREQKRGLSAELDTAKASLAATTKERDALAKKAAAFDAHADETAELRKERDAAVSTLTSFKASASAHQAMLSADGVRVTDEDVRELTLMKYNKYAEAEGAKAQDFGEWFGEQSSGAMYKPFQLATAAPVEAPPVGEAAPPAAAPDAPAAPPAPVPRDLTAHAPPPNGGPVSIWKRLADSPDGLRKEFDMAAPLPK